MLGNQGHCCLRPTTTLPEDVSLQVSVDRDMQVVQEYIGKKWSFIFVHRIYLFTGFPKTTICFHIFESVTLIKKNKKKKQD